MRQQFSRWGAPKEQRDEVTADIGKLVFQGLQTLQTERTKVREPQLFSWNGSREWRPAMPAERGFLCFLMFFRFSLNIRNQGIREISVIRRHRLLSR